MMEEVYEAACSVYAGGGSLGMDGVGVGARGVYSGSVVEEELRDGILTLDTWTVPFGLNAEGSLSRSPALCGRHQLQCTWRTKKEWVCRLLYV